MNGPATGSHRTYGNLNASDNTRLILGDVQIGVIYNFCPCSSDNATNSHHAIRLSDRDSRSFAHDSGSTFDGDTKPKKTRQGYGCQEQNVSAAKRQDMKNVRNSRDIETIYLHKALASTTTAASTINTQGLSETEALISGPEIIPKPALDASQRTSTSSIPLNKVTYQNSKAASTYDNDAKCGGTDYHYRTSTASLQAPASAREISVIFKDDLAKPCTFAREDTQHRIFFLSKEGPDWTQSTCSESLMPTSQIKDRIKRGPTKSKPKKQNIELTLKKLEPRRRYISEYLLQKVNHYDPFGHKWTIVAIDDENSHLTRRTGEVAIFSVILAKASDDRSSM